MVELIARGRDGELFLMAVAVAKIKKIPVWSVWGVWSVRAYLACAWRSGPAGGLEIGMAFEIMPA
jgi:hypothetical protein